MVLMDATSSAMWFTIALVFVAALITKVARRKTTVDLVCSMPTPPVVNGSSIIGLIRTLHGKGFQAMIHEQYTRLGSVFTISLFRMNITFLIGPEVSDHFYQGLDSDISFNMYGFIAAMVGKDAAWSVDATIYNEQARFYGDALKSAKLRSHVDPILQEVEDYFEKWGQEGVVDLKQELDQLLLLISARCLLGKEVRANIFNEIFTLFDEMVDNGMGLTSVLFPYAPTPANRRRDRARAKLSETFSKVVRSRKSKISNQVEDDVLQTLIDSKYRDGRATTESEVTGMVVGLLLAGRHTSSATSTWTGARLLSHERWLAAAAEEQRQLMAKHGSHMDYSVLQEMQTLSRCIKETLRMHPAAPALFRKVHRSFTVRTREGDEYEIPKGHTVVSPIVFSGKIPNVFKNPDVFDPDRFGPGREEDRVAGKFAYLAFGGGRHVCPGEAYSSVQIKVIWSHLLRNFDLKLVSPFPETDWRKMVPEAKGKVMVTYKRRTAAT